MKHRRGCSIGFGGFRCWGLRARQLAGRAAVGTIGLCLLAACVGCAGANWPRQAGIVPDPQAERKQQVVRQFDQKRDRAEFEAAWSAWQRGDIDGAAQSLHSLLSRNPQHRDALLLMIDVAVAANRPQQALRYAQTARDSFPDDAELQYAVATVLDYANRQAEALPCYDRAARLDPDNEVYTVAYHAAREALMGRSPVPSAASAQTGAASPDRPNTAPSGARGNNSCVGDGYTAGEEVAELMRRAEDALRTGQPELALALFGEAARRADDPQTVIRAATAALRYDYPDLALELLEPAAARFSDCAALHCVLGVARYRLGDYRSSQVALRQALSLDNSSALAYFLMGCTLRKLGQFQQAEAHFRQAAVLEPGYAGRQ